MNWVFLCLAIVAEVIGTSALKMSNGFTDWRWSVGTVLSYAVAFYLLALVIKTIPVGVAYALWSGVGIALITLIGVVAFKQHLDLYGYIGIGLILAGVVVLNTLSKSAGH